MVVRDRLAELKSRNEYTNRSSESSEEFIVDLYIEPSKEHLDIIQHLDRFSEITRWIKAIRENIDEMRKLISSPVFHYNDKDIRNGVEKKIRENIEICRKIHVEIKKLETEIENDQKQWVTLFRIKHIQYMLIRDDYLNAYREHEMFINYYEEKMKKIMIKEAKTKSYNITDEEATELVANKQMAFFVDNILEETEKQRQQLQDIMARHSQLETLEKSLVEVRDLFVRISAMVMEQGTLIQVIEYHADKTTHNVDKAAKTMEKARDFQIKALKKKTCIAVWLAVILLVLILIVVVF